MGIPFINREFYYICAKKPSGGYVFIGPYSSEAEAKNKGFEKLKGVLFEVEKSRYRDLSRATRELKAKLLDRTGNLDESTQRVAHDYKEQPQENE